VISLWELSAVKDVVEREESLQRLPALIAKESSLNEAIEEIMTIKLLASKTFIYIKSIEFMVLFIACS